MAGDYLLGALLRRPIGSRFSVFLDPGQPTGPAAQEILHARGLEANPIDVRGRTSILNGGFPSSTLSLWLDIYGTGIEAFSLRNHFGGRVYPIVTLQHAFSGHPLLYERFLRLLLMGGHGCDSILCTSRAGRKGLENVFLQLSESIERDLGVKATFRGRFDTIPLCVDTDFYRPINKHKARKELGLPRDAVILIYVGYISPMKADLVPMLTVLKRLVVSNPKQKLSLVLAGSGWDNYVSLLRNRARELGISRELVIFSDITDDTKQMALGAADIFVSPSDTPQEAFGLTPIEAMAVGLPQVVSDWNGYRETVRHGETGFLIPTLWCNCDDELRGTGDLLGWRYDHMVLSQSLAIDTSILFERLQQLISNEELRLTMATRSRERAVQNFGFDVIARQHHDLWRALVEDASHCGKLCPASTFDQPSYSTVFAHYPTRNIDPELMVTMTGEARHLTWRDLLAANGWGRPVLDEALLNLILDSLQEATGRGTTSSSVGALVSELRGRYRDGVVHRHILWLIKYGLLTYSSACPTPAQTGASVSFHSSPE